MKTKISDAAVEAALDVYYAGNPGDGPDELKAVMRAALEAALPHLFHVVDEEDYVDVPDIFTHPQPAALNEVGGDERARFEAWAPNGHLNVMRNPDGDYIFSTTQTSWIAWQAALAATGKQQASTFDGGGDYYADQHGDGAWATYRRDGDGWVYNFGHGEDAEVRAKSVARELNRQVEALAARPTVGDEERAELFHKGWKAGNAYAHGIDPSPIATRKLAELAAQGYVTNGVAIFNPATGQRGLVDNLGFVGWMGAKHDAGAGVEK